MAVQCKLIKCIDPRNPEAEDEKRVVHAVSTGLYGFEQMAEDICHSCSLTEGDVTAAMRSMLHFAREALLAGQTVEMEGLGRFRISVKSRLCTLDETTRRGFSVADAVRQFKVIYTPDVRLRRLIDAQAEPSLTRSEN